MSDSCNGAGDTDRAALLAKYIEEDAVSLLVTNLGNGILDERFTFKFEEMGAEIGKETWTVLHPLNAAADDDLPRDVLVADAISTIVTGEMFVALSCEAEALAAEGQRLVANGREHLEKLVQADA